MSLQMEQMESSEISMMTESSDSIASFEAEGCGLGMFKECSITACRIESSDNKPKPGRMFITSCGGCTTIVAD